MTILYLTHVSSHLGSACYLTTPSLSPPKAFIPITHPYKSNHPIPFPHQGQSTIPTTHLFPLSPTFSITNLPSIHIKLLSILRHPVTYFRKIYICFSTSSVKWTTRSGSFSLSTRLLFCPGEKRARYSIDSILCLVAWLVEALLSFAFLWYSFQANIWSPNICFHIWILT